METWSKLGSKARIACTEKLAFLYFHAMLCLNSFLQSSTVCWAAGADTAGDISSSGGQCETGLESCAGGGWSARTLSGGWIREGFKKFIKIPINRPLFSKNIFYAFYIISSLKQKFLLWEILGIRNFLFNIVISSISLTKNLTNSKLYSDFMLI